MVTGFAVCLYYMLRASPVLGGNAQEAWFGILPMAAGVFGVPAGLFTVVVVSLLTPRPSRTSAGMVDYIRAPE
jgi:cation/acetate symporter